MPRPKGSGKSSKIRWTLKAWKIIEGKGDISKFVNEAVEDWGQQQPETHTDTIAPAATAPDIEYLNIDEKDGPIQIYLRKREARLELSKERIAESQAKSDIRIAEANARAKIKEETANKTRFAKRYIQTGKSKVDWGNSEGEGEPDWHEGYR